MEDLFPQQQHIYYTLEKLTTTTLGYANRPCWVGLPQAPLLPPGAVVATAKLLRSLECESCTGPMKGRDVSSLVEKRHTKYSVIGADYRQDLLARLRARCRPTLVTSTCKAINHTHARLQFSRHLDNIIKRIISCPCMYILLLWHLLLRCP